MKKKLELNKLQVSSFVTELNRNTEQTIKGGTAPAAPAASWVAIRAVTAVVGAVIAGGALAYEVANGQSWALCSENEPNGAVTNNNKEEDNK